MACETRAQLAKGVSDALEDIRRLTERQLEVLSTNVHFFNEIDRKLDQAVMEKETRLRSLRVHEQEHGCA